MGRHEAARAEYEALAQAVPGNGNYQAWLGLLSAHVGDTAGATAVIARLESGEIAVTPQNSVVWRALITNAVGNRERAIALFRESQVRAMWVHRDPVLRSTLLTIPEFAAYLEPEG